MAWGWKGMPSCVSPGKGRKGWPVPVAEAQVAEHHGGERFENEEGVLQGMKFLLERRVCVAVRAQGSRARKL